MRLNAVHTVFSLSNSKEQLCQASSDDIQVCVQKKQKSALSFDITTNLPVKRGLVSYFNIEFLLKNFFMGTAACGLSLYRVFFQLLLKMISTIDR